MRRTKMKPLPEGFTCRCGKFNKFSAWLLAHWDIEVVFTCECDRVYIVFEGEVEEL